MSKVEFFERYLLKSLIEDLESASNPECLDRVRETKFSSEPNSSKTSVSSSKERSTDAFSKSQESVNKYQNITNISRDEIWSALTDQKSTKNIQKVIRSFSSEDIAPILGEIKGTIGKMMMNRNGNYLCNDIFKICSSEQRLSILQEICPIFEVISNNEFGTHPIQSLIENANTPEEINVIINAILSKKKLIKLSQNSNGTYVIQKIISNIPESSRDGFNSLLINCFNVLSIDMYGMCIIKKFISFSQSKSIISHIISKLVNNFIEISENQYGNYLIQSILELWWNKKETVGIKEYVFKHFYRLSTNQYGSHVTETFIKMLTISEKVSILQNLMQNGCYYFLINDKYGMFVMNKLINSIKKYRSNSTSNGIFAYYN